MSDAARYFATGFMVCETTEGGDAFPFCRAELPRRSARHERIAACLNAFRGVETERIAGDPAGALFAAARLRAAENPPPVLLTERNVYGLFDVPEPVATCPECGAPAMLEVLTWEPGTGIPDQVALFCAREEAASLAAVCEEATEADRAAYDRTRHRKRPEEWQGAEDRARAWAGANVRMEDCRSHTGFDRGEGKG